MGKIMHKGEAEGEPRPRRRVQAHEIIGSVEETHDHEGTYSEVGHGHPDGPGSGLDADTLDGVEGSGYVKVGDDADTLGSGTATDGHVLTADGAGGAAWEAAAGGGGPQVVAKSADETVTSSTTLQDDDHLTLAVSANTTYVGRVVLLASVAGGSFTPDIKWDFSAPAGATGTHGIDAGQAEPLSTALNDNIGGGGDGDWVEILVFVTVGGTAGNLTLRWAQNTSDANGTTVKAGSHMILHAA